MFLEWYFACPKTDHVVQDHEQADDEGEQDREADISHAAGQTDRHGEKDRADLAGRTRCGAKADQ